MAVYSIRTWDMEAQEYTPQNGVPCDGLTLWQLRASMRLLRSIGYSCHRLRDPDGGHDDNDAWVKIERSDESELQ